MVSIKEYRMRETTLRASITKLPSAPRVSAMEANAGESTEGSTVPVLRFQQGLATSRISVSRALPMLTRQHFEEAQGTCTTPQLATAI